MNLLVLYVAVWMLISFAIAFCVEYRGWKGSGSLLITVGVFLLSAALSNLFGGERNFAIGIVAYIVGMFAGSIVAGLRTKDSHVDGDCTLEPARPLKSNHDKPPG
jgi:hypothetical protein